MQPATGTVFLVRHGRTALNVGNRFRGLEDVPLDEVGLAEVQETGERLKGAIDPARPPTQVFTSPMSRTRSTAAAVARHFDLEPVPDEPWHFDVPTASITEMAVVQRSPDERSVTPVRIGWKD